MFDLKAVVLGLVFLVFLAISLWYSARIITYCTLGEDEE